MKLNELKVKRLEATKALNTLFGQQSAAKGKVASLLESQIKAGISGTEESRKAVADAKAVAEALDEQVSAQRTLVLSLEEQLQAEEERIAAETAIARKAGPIPTHDNRQDRPWSSLGEQLRAVANAAMPGGTVDPRLYQAAASGANTTVPSEGGFLVMHDFSTRLLERAVETSQLLPLCDTYEASPGSDRLEAPYIDETSRATGSRWGGVRVYRRGEADTVTATKPKFADFELKLEDLMAICYATGRSLEDAGLLEQIITKAFASEFAFKVDDEILNGLGGGQMAGLFNSTANPALVTQAIESGQTLALGAIVTKNISNMWMHMPARLKGGSVWLYNGELGPALDELSIPSGTAALEPRFVNYGPDGILRIKGRPAIEVEQCAAPGTVGDFALVNLGEYAILTKGGLKTDASMHVRFLYDEMTFRFMTRINGKPKWRSSVTPYKGSAARSPYVVLNTRS